jgi:hypothetical protein
MNKKVKLAMICFGLVFLSFGAYLLVVESMIEREFTDLKQGTADVARIKSLAEYPFIQKDIVTYNANLANIYTADQLASVVENLHRILAESNNPELRFRTSLLLGNIYSTLMSGQNAQEGLAAAVGLYVQALKIKPDDLFAKLALEKILNQAQPSQSSQVKEEIKQGKPKNQQQQKSWGLGDKGDEI